MNYMYKCLDESDKSAYKFRLRDIAVVETFFATGARVYEISNIREDSINLNTGLIRLMGKGGKERYVQISNTSVLETLKKYYAENVQAIKKSGYFFVNRRGNRFTEQSMRLMLKKYTKLVGIERNITPHMFRHPYVKPTTKNKLAAKAEIPNYQHEFDSLRFLLFCLDVQVAHDKQKPYSSNVTYVS